MTKIVEGVLDIAPEDDAECELCGKTAELRPYGPNGERVCFACGMKDQAAVDAAIKRLFDEAPEGVTVEGQRLLPVSDGVTLIIVAPEAD